MGDVGDSVGVGRWDAVMSSSGDTPRHESRYVISHTTPHTDWYIGDPIDHVFVGLGSALHMHVLGRSLMIG